MTNIFFVSMYLLIFTTTMWLIGKLVFSVTKTHQSGFFLKHFSFLLTGITISITIFSAAKTKGITISLILGLLAIAIYVKNPKTNIAMTTETTKRNITLLVLFISISFLWQFFIFFDFNNASLFLPFSDEILYMKMSSRLRQNGAENYYGATNFGYLLNTATPYHYFDLWLDAMISSIVKLNPLTIKLFISTPFLYFVLFTGIAAIIESEKVNSIILFLFLPFFTGVYIDIYTKISIFKNLSYGVSILNPMCFSKIVPVYLFSISAYLFYKNKHHAPMILSLLMTITVNIAMAPAVLGGLTIWALLIAPKEKRNESLCYISMFTLLFGIFYKLFEGGSQVKLSEFIFFHSSTHNLIISIKTITVYVLQYVLVFTPWLLFTITFGSIKSIQKNTSTEQKNISILAFLIVAGGLLSWALLCLLYDAKQFFTIPLTVISHIYFTVLTSKILATTHHKNKLLIATLTGTTIATANNIKYRMDTVKNANMYAPGFVSQVEQEFSKIQNKDNIQGAVILAPDEKPLAPDVFSTGNFLYYLDYNLQPTNLSADDIFGKNLDPNESYFTSPAVALLPLTPIHIFMKESQLTGVEAKIGFVKKFNLRYIVFSREATIEKFWGDLTEIMLADPVSQERIIFLKNE